MSNKLIKTLARQNMELNQMYYINNLEKLGLEDQLKDIYNPIINSQTKISDKIENLIKKIEESKTEEQTRGEVSKTALGEISELLKTFPDLLNKLRGEDPRPLTNEENVIVGELIDLSDDEIQELIMPPEEFIDKPEEIIAPPKEFEDKTKKKRSRKRMSNETPEIAEMIDALENNKEDKIKDINDDNDKFDKLAKFIADNAPVKITNTSKYRDYNKKLPGIVERAYMIRNEKEKVGTGNNLISFLPSSTKDLISEMNRLMGSYTAGNKNAFNEISAITDILRRRGKLSLKDAKKIFSYFKPNLNGKKSANSNN